MENGDCVKHREACEASFFGVFSFGHMMHDAIDKGLVYEYIEITRDVTTASGLRLKKGDKYDAVWVMFERAEFQFVIWKEVDKFHSEPRSDSVFIPMSELAPYLCWKQ